MWWIYIRALMQLLVRLPPEHVSGCFTIHTCNIYTTIYNVLFHVIINLTYCIRSSGFSSHQGIRLFSLNLSLFSRVHNYEMRAVLSFCLDFLSTQKLFSEILECGIYLLSFFFFQIHQCQLFWKILQMTVFTDRCMNAVVILLLKHHALMVNISPCNLAAQILSSVW